MLLERAHCSLLNWAEAVTACTVAFLSKELSITDEAEEQSLPCAWGGKQHYPKNLPAILRTLLLSWAKGIHYYVASPLSYGSGRGL